MECLMCCFDKLAKGVLETEKWKEKGDEKRMHTLVKHLCRKPPPLLCELPKDAKTKAKNQKSLLDKKFYQGKLNNTEPGWSMKVQKGKACKILNNVFKSLVEKWQGSNGGRPWQGKQGQKTFEHQKLYGRGCIHLLRYIN